ncbi:TrmO family methyltransferase [Anaerospora sp.]
MFGGGEVLQGVEIGTHIRKSFFATRSPARPNTFGLSVVRLNQR